MLAFLFQPGISPFSSPEPPFFLVTWSEKRKVVYDILSLRTSGSGDENGISRDEKNESDYMDFSAHLAGLKILARFENTGLGFLARAESSSCNRQFDYKRIYFRSRDEISARDEIRHVIRP